MFTREQCAAAVRAIYEAANLKWTRTETMNGREITLDNGEDDVAMIYEDGSADGYAITSETVPEFVESGWQVERAGDVTKLTRHDGHTTTRGGRRIDIIKTAYVAPLSETLNLVRVSE